MKFRKPTFFIVGAPKCGTTWLHRYLKMHPSVFMPRAKEPHYFNTDSGWRWFPRLEDYEELFAQVPDSALQVGEASVLYLYSQVAVANILEYAPDAKFIAMVRNPVEMVPSLHQQLLFSQDETVTDFEQAWRLQAERAQGRSMPPFCHDPRVLQYRDACSLGEQVERLVGLAGRERVLVLVMDDIKAQPEREFARVLEFLGLPPWQPESFAVVNEAKARRFPLLKKLTLRAAAVKRRLGMRWSLGILHNLNTWNVKRKARAPVRPELQAELEQAFAGDIGRLESLLGRDLSHWRRTPEAG